MFICTHCGGQNALHFSNCPHYANKPRVHAARPAPVGGSTRGPLPYMHKATNSAAQAEAAGRILEGMSPTGRQNMSYPQMQNLPGTLAHAIEIAEAKRGPLVHRGSETFSMQAADPSEPHRSMARMEPQLTDEQKLVKLLGPGLNAVFTHRDKGGRYRLQYTPLPAGEVMRKVGDTVVYTSLDNKGVYVRDLKDFVAIMQPLLLSDN